MSTTGRITDSQRACAAGSTARARQRMEQLRQHGERGNTFEDAYAAIGLTRDGARKLMVRFTGSSHWPPHETEDAS